MFKPKSSGKYYPDFVAELDDGRDVPRQLADKLGNCLNPVR
jgi:hypothetical protein